MKPTVTVIGGAGFIGSHLVSLLLSNNYRVILLDDLSTGSLDNLQNDLENPDLTVYRLDLLKHSALGLAQLIKTSTHVFHLAAKTSVEESLAEPVKYFRINFLATVIVVEAMRLAGVKHLIFSSTSAVYGDTDSFPTPESSKLNPLSPYALSKLTAEQFIAQQQHISSVSLRYFNVYGDRPNLTGSYRPVMSVFLEKARAGEALPIVNAGSQTRDFVNVNDVARANLAAMQITESHHVFNVGSGKELSVKQIADLISTHQTRAADRIEPSRSLAKIDKISTQLGWKPLVDFKEWISLRIEPQTF